MGVEKKKRIITGIILSAVYFLRFMFLDADVKTFSVAQVQPIDELYYNELAVKIFKYGMTGLTDGAWSSPSVANARTFFLPNMLTALSLKIFGNNFWGLKIPYVFMGYMAGVLLYVIARHILAGHERMQLLIMIAYVCDFNILMLSREAVTVVPCMLACVIAVLGMIKIKNVIRKWAVLGFWSVAAFCLVYMGLPFIFIAAITLLCFSVIFEKSERIKKIISYIGGSCSGLLLSEVISVLFFQQHIFETLKDTMTAHGRKIGGLSVFKSIKNMLANAASYWSSNMFRYNYMILFLAVLAIFMLLYGTIVYRDKLAFIFLVFIASHWMQTIFLNNMTPSKAAITFPIVLLAVGYAVSIYAEKMFEINGVKRDACLFFIGFLSAGCLIIEYWALGSVKKCFQYCILGCAVVTIAGVFVYVIFRSKKLFGIAYLSNMLIMCGMGIYYAFWNPTYTDKNMMTDLGVETSDGMVLNGVGFNLYNLCESPANIYDHYKGTGYDYDTVWQSMVDACYNYEELYYVGYYASGNEWNVENINERLKDTPWKFVEIKIYAREYGRDEPGNHDSDEGLWKKALRGE